MTKRCLFIKFPVHVISKDNEKAFNRFTGRPYTSKRFKDFERNLQHLAAAQMPDGFKRFEFEDVELALHMVFKNRVRPDIGNCPKSICDAFNGLIWRDDKQIIKMNLSIEYDAASGDYFTLEAWGK